MASIPSTDLLGRALREGREEIGRFGRGGSPRPQREFLAQKRAKSLSNECSSRIHFQLSAGAQPRHMASEYIEQGEG